MKPIVESQAGPKTPNMFFKSLSEAYSEQNYEKINQRFTELIGKAYMFTNDKWKMNFDFSKYADIDNLAPIYVNMLETIKEWMVARTESDEGIFNGFKIYINLLALGLKYIDDMQEKNAWFLPVIKCIIRRSKRVLIEARNAALKVNKPTDKLVENLLHQLRYYKSSRTMDPKTTKREISLLINTLQVSIYFNSHDFSKSQRTLDLIKRHILDYTSQELNNFYFQFGKINLINCKFLQAEQYFEKIQIHRKSQRDLIMRYLIPCKMFLGKMRVENDFIEYVPLTQAITKGDFNTFTKAIQRFQKLWIKRGIYLVMERMRILVWRNFIKKVASILGDKIQMEYIVKAVKLKGGDESLNECMCIISNLIFQGFIKGYIYFTETKRTLVLKKGGAFPKLQKIAQDNEKQTR